MDATTFLDALRGAGFSFVSGTPCSYLKPLINAVIGDERFCFRDAVNEGDAVAMAAGATVGGRAAVAMFQNSGLGNAVNALTSLCAPFRVPVLLIVTHRGEPGGKPDEPQHALMGEITTGLLDTMRVPWRRFPRDAAAATTVLAEAQAHFAATGWPFALVMSQGDLEPHALAPRAPRAPIGERRIAFCETLQQPDEARPSRTAALGAIRAARRADEVLVATTGYTGRELYALGDDPWNLYTVGSMGSASALGLGIALAQAERPVTVIDGDGAVLMRLGNLATLGAYAPANFTHVVLDNEAHDSTGGQATVSRGVALGAIAQACGYGRIVSTDTLAGLEAALAARGDGAGPVLVHLRTRRGAPKDLPRPRVTPAAVLRRLQIWMGVAALSGGED